MTRFVSYKPSEALRHLVDKFIISESGGEGAYNVLPQTSFVVGFQYRGRLFHVNEACEKILDPAGITGLFATYRTFKNAPDTGTVLVYFRAGAISAFLHEPAHELFGQSTSLYNFFPQSELLFLKERLCECNNDWEKINAVEKFLISHLRPVTSDPLVQNALELIYRSRGTIRVHELTSMLNVSESPFEKRFRAVVGASAKKFSTVVRLQYVIQQQKTCTSLTGLAFDAGYFDQPHFIKQFKAFTGSTPEKFFSRRHKNGFLQSGS